MPNYRRAFVPRGCRFFTANLLERRDRTLRDSASADDRAAVPAKPSRRTALENGG
jgi:putative transposase